MRQTKPVLRGNIRQRAQKIFHRRRKDAQEIGQQADEKIEKLLIRRFDRLVSVRRFVILWVSLFVLIFFLGVVQLRSLSPNYQSLQPVPGGIFAEGLVGTFTNANPIYATGTANAAVSRLIFSGLFKYDRANKLVGDLAESITPDATQKNYLVKLKTNIRWHDGHVFSADDVVFTYESIQNPVAQSPLYTSYQGITVTKVDNYTVNFKLPSPLSAFAYSLTNGIIPKHLLDNIPQEQLRSAPFNTRPVGTGPFSWKFVEVNGSSNTDRQQRVTLQPFNNYWHGRPKLDGFSIVTYSNEPKLIKAYKSKQINAMSGLDSIPEEVVGDKNTQVYKTPLTSAVYNFFNNSRSPLNEVNFRKAMISSINVRPIIASLDYPAKPVKSPLLDFQVGFDPSIGQLPYNPDYANQVFDQLGYTRGADGLRQKDGKTLELFLSSQDSGEYTKVAAQLQQQWSRVGVKVTIRYFNSTDLQTDIIATHDYDMLLYGISLGVDPDVYAYWDSTQASTASQGRLNLSEYKSTTADQALEAGRTRPDAATRALKYRSFLNAWVADAPALGLYRPSFLYISHGPIFGYERKAMVRPTDRFSNVYDWMVRQERQDL